MYREKQSMCRVNSTPLFWLYIRGLRLHRFQIIMFYRLYFQSHYLEEHYSCQTILSISKTWGAKVELLERGGVSKFLHKTWEYAFPREAILLPGDVNYWFWELFRHRLPSPQLLSSILCYLEFKGSIQLCLSLSLVLLTLGSGWSHAG
jgi:hypothetical protein